MGAGRTADGAVGTVGTRAQAETRVDRQAIIASRSAPRLDGRAPSRKRSGMWVIYLEALLAVSLVLFIVWWTMRGRK